MGATISIEAWNDIEQRTLILRRSMRIAEGKVTILNLLMNPGDHPCDFQLPPPHLPSRVLLDSADAASHERPVTENEVPVAAHSAVLLYSEYAG
jgi:pullulanase/glycogen debranching enzyme